MCTLFPDGTVMGNPVNPLKLGIRVHPPAVTLVYQNAADQERYRVMPVRFLNKFGSVENVLKELKEKHKEYLDKVSRPNFLSCLLILVSGFNILFLMLWFISLFPAHWGQG